MPPASFWELVRRPAGCASGQVVNCGDSIIATISSDTDLPRMRSRIVVDLIRLCHKCAHIYISGHVHKCNPGLNFADEIWFAKFYTPQKFIPLRCKRLQQEETKQSQAEEVGYLTDYFSV